MEAVGIGDLHLDSPLTEIIENYNSQVIKEIDKVLKYAYSHGIENIFLYGDISDNSNLSQDALKCLLDLFYRHKDLLFFIILGNHDKKAKDSIKGHSLKILKTLRKFKLLENVRIFSKPKSVNIGKEKVRFLPWPSTDFDESALNVAHIEVYKSKADNGRVFSTDRLSKSKAVVVSGHLHTAHSVRNTYYSGTLYQTKFGQSKDCYFHHIVFNGVEDYEISLIPHVPDYELITVHVENKNDLVDLPKSKFKKIKLVIDNPGVDLSNLDNPGIVKLTPFSKEFREVKESISINTNVFFKSWMKTNYPSRAKILYKVRLRLLNGS